MTTSTGNPFDGGTPWYNHRLMWAFTPCALTRELLVKDWIMLDVGCVPNG